MELLVSELRGHRESSELRRFVFTELSSSMGCSAQQLDRFDRLGHVAVALSFLWCSAHHALLSEYGFL